MKKANIYHDNNGTWYAALWIDGDYDACHELEAESESDARQECVETFGDVVVKRVDERYPAKVEISKHNGGNNIHVGFLTIDADSYDCSIKDVGNECIRDLEDMATESTIPATYEWTGDEVFEVVQE